MRQVVVVLGMHRSGSSSLAGLLHHMGCEVGPDQLPHLPQNPRGFFERWAFLLAHERILKTLGVQWHGFLPFPPGWEKGEAMAGIRADLANCVRRDYADSALWVLKDPRVCRMLPLWLDLFRELDIRPTFVFLHRHPSEIAQSLRARDGFPFEKSHLLWLSHILEAEFASRGFPRAIIQQNALLTDWRGAVSRIQEETGLQFPRSIAEAAPAMDAFLSPELCHFHAEGHEGHLHPLVQRTADLLSTATRNSLERDQAAFDALRVEFEGLGRLFAPVFRDAALIAKRDIDYDLLVKAHSTSCNRPTVTETATAFCPAPLGARANTGN